VRSAVAGGAAAVRAALALALVFGAAPASATVTVASFAVTPSSTQAGANPSLTQDIRFTSSPGDTVRNLTLALPPGLLANPTVGPACASADLQAGTCPAASRVDDGTSTVSVTTFGIPVDAPAQLYLVAPLQGELARIGLVVAFGGVRVVSEGSVSARTSTDSGLDIRFADLPSTLPGSSEPLQIDRVNLTLPGTVNGARFTRNPTACAAATTRLAGASHGGSAFAAESAFTPTGCELLPFAPGLTAAATLAPPSDGAAVTTTITQADGEAAVKSTKLTLPRGLTPRLTAVTRACSLPDAAACPESATVGSAVISTPLQGTPLDGRVVLVSGTPLPGLAIVLPPPFPLRLAGTTALGATGLTATFAGIPDVPIASLRVSFAGGSNSLLVGSTMLCAGSHELRGEFGAHSGKAAAASARLAVSGCAAAPATKPTGTLSLRGLGGRNPLLELALSSTGAGAGRAASANEGARATGAAHAAATGALRGAIVRLPRGLGVRKRGLSRALRVTAGGRVVRGAGRVVDGRLRIRLSGAGASSLRVTLRRPSLRVSRSLARRVRAGRAGRLAVRVTVGTTGRAPVTLTLRARPRTR
jgi:hypothetical protein